MSNVCTGFVPAKFEGKIFYPSPHPSSTACTHVLRTHTQNALSHANVPALRLPCAFPLACTKSFTLFHKQDAPALSARQRSLTPLLRTLTQNTLSHANVPALRLPCAFPLACTKSFTLFHKQDAPALSARQRSLTPLLRTHTQNANSVLAHFIGLLTFERKKAPCPSVRTPSEMARVDDARARPKACRLQYGRRPLVSTLGSEPDAPLLLQLAVASACVTVCWNLNSGAV